MATPLSIATDRRDDGTFVLTATGEIDMSNIDSFAGALSTVKSDGEATTIDLSGVDYLDSGAINVLFAYAEGLRLIANPILIPVLRISGLADVATIERAG
jgi:anti-anti-sigma factor